MRFPVFRVLVSVLVLTPLVRPASAQLTLPGAVAPTPAGAAVAPAARARPVAQKPRRRVRGDGEEAPTTSSPPQKIVPVETLAGQTFNRDGGKSQIAFERHEKALTATHLSLVGEAMSNSRQACQVDVPGTPLGVTDLGDHDGVARVQLALPICPIAFDVLEGAILASGEPQACEFKEADCRVSPGGLWGPTAAALGPDKQKAIDRARAQAEQAVRANFKRLLAATKDKLAIMGYAREQAGFSSMREEICRDYAGEARHGFCAARLTEARAAALHAKADAAGVAKEERKREKAARKKGA